MFAVRTAQGAQWDDACGIREQAFWDEHAEFADGLVAKGVIVFGGPIASDDSEDIALLAVDAPDKEAVHEAFAQDPWIKHGIFRLKEVRQWSIWLDGRANHPGH
jgi:uncharacterized protein YciI